MFDNISKKIKTLVYVLFVFGCLTSFALAILRVLNTSKNLSFEEAAGVIFIALLIFVGGSFLSWVSCFLMYGFAELIERTAHIDEMLSRRAEEYIDDDEEDEAQNETKRFWEQRIYPNAEEEVNEEDEPFHNTVDP